MARCHRVRADGEAARHLFVKPLTTKRAAAAYGYELAYRSKPGWETYRSVLDFARTVRDDVADLGPRDLIDIQSFIWVLGSDEYAEARAAVAPGGATANSRRSPLGRRRLCRCLRHRVVPT